MGNYKIFSNKFFLRWEDEAKFDATMRSLSREYAISVKKERASHLGCTVSFQCNFPDIRLLPTAFLHNLNDMRICDEVIVLVERYDGISPNAFASTFIISNDGINYMEWFHFNKNTFEKHLQANYNRGYVLTF